MIGNIGVLVRGYEIPHSKVVLLIFAKGLGFVGYESEESYRGNGLGLAMVADSFFHNQETS